MVGGPAHGPRVDVVQLAACTRARRALAALAIPKQLLLAISHRFWDCAVVAVNRLPRVFLPRAAKPLNLPWFTTMQRMSHLVRSLRPPPDIALECVC